MEPSEDSSTTTLPPATSLPASTSPVEPASTSLPPDTLAPASTHAPLAPPTAARKRDRESALGSGAVTPSGSDDSRGLGLTPVAKKGRVQGSNTSPTTARHPIADAATTADIDEDVESPPDTPPMPSLPPVVPNSTPAPGPETSRVHDIRQKVQRMSTGEGGAEGEEAIVPDEVEQPKSRPASIVVADDTDMASVRGASPTPGEPAAVDAPVVSEAPASPTAASPSTPLATKSPSSFASFSKSASPFASVPGSSKPSFGGSAAKTSPFGKVLPLSKPNLAALANATNPELGPPSPASSIRAEIGSAPPTSRQASYSGSARAESLAPEPAGTPRAASPLAHRTEENASPLVPDTPAPAGAVAPPPTPASGTEAPAPAAAPTPSAFAARFTNANSGFGKAASSTTGTTSAFGSFSSAASPFGSVRTQPYPARRPSKGDATATVPASLFGAVKSTNKEDGEAGTSEKRTFGELLKEGGEKEVEKEDVVPRQLFKEQEVVTGEEDEELLYSIRGKLYVMEDGQWRERGTGQLRVNSKLGGASPRLVMRAEATHRLLLNAALFPGFSAKSSDRMVQFATFAEGKLASYALRTSNAATSAATAKAIEAAVASLSTASATDDEAV